MNRIRRLGRDERGFTMTEVMIAMLVSLLVIGATASAFVRNSDSALSGQREGQLTAVAQQQLEAIRGIASRYGFADVALNGKPAAPTDCSGQCTLPPCNPIDPKALPCSPTDPNDFILGWSSAAPSYLIEKNFNLTSGGEIGNAPNSGETLEIDAVNGQVSPMTTGVSVGSGTATVYRYITQAALPCNSAAAPAGLGLPCAADDARRVIVAVKLDNPSGSGALGPNTPVYMSTVLSNPIPSNQPNNSVGLRVGLNIG